MKTSIITWDASFRESYHTIDSFGNQDFDENKFEFIWVDFYNNQNSKLIEKINAYKNFQLLNLNNSKDTKWHLGKCINEAVKIAKGDIIVIPDGDVIVYPDMLSIIEKELNNSSDKVLFFRRWDEPKEKHNQEYSYNINYLEKNCVLNNPTNYAGTIALSKSLFNQINGYEVSDIFSGPGANAMELYIRLRNYGAYIKWHNQKIFHPYHNFTSYSDKNISKVKKLSEKYKWVKPYCGIKQSWVLYCREKELEYKSDQAYIQECIARMPTDLLKEKKRNFLQKTLSLIKK